MITTRGSTTTPVTVGSLQRCATVHINVLIGRVDRALPYGHLGKIKNRRSPPQAKDAVVHHYKIRYVRWSCQQEVISVLTWSRWQRSGPMLKRNQPLLLTRREVVAANRMQVLHGVRSAGTYAMYTKGRLPRERNASGGFSRLLSFLEPMTSTVHNKLSWGPW